MNAFTWWQRWFLESCLTWKYVCKASFNLWELRLVWSTYPRRVVHALARGLSATLHPPHLTELSGSGTGLCLTCVEQTAMIRQDRSYGWLSGTDGLVKMDVKVTKTKHKNKFMWSIKNQLVRPKFLPKTLAFHRLEHHYSPCCHSNDMLVDFHHLTLNLPAMPVK